MPHALEVPGMGRAVVPGMCARLALIRKFIADRIPAYPAIIGAMGHLPKPIAAL